MRTPLDYDWIGLTRRQGNLHWSAACPSQSSLECQSPTGTINALQQRTMLRLKTAALSSYV
jgi:hypothetical protein